MRTAQWRPPSPDRPAAEPPLSAITTCGSSIYKWARRTHPNKPTRWIVRRYFGAFHRSRRDQWVFGHRDSGAYLLKLAWTRIVRHQMVTGTASPDDPALTDYWNTQRRKGIRLPIDSTLGSGLVPVLALGA